MAVTHATDSRTLNQVWAHCRSHVEPTLQDAWTQGGNLLKFLSDEKYAGAKIMKTLPGGADIRCSEEIGKIPTYPFTGYDQVTLQADDPFTQAKWDWRKRSVPFGVAFDELWRTNGEKEKIGTLLKNKTQNAINSLSEDLTIDLLRGNESSDGETYSSTGTLGNGKCIDGIRYAFNYQNDQSDGYANIGRGAPNTWFRHEIQDVGGNAFTASTGSVTAEPLLNYLDEYILKCTWGKANEKINLLLTNLRVMNNLAKRARFNPTPIQLMVRKNLVDLGIQCLEYNGIPMIYEPELDNNRAGASGESGDCVYGFNAKYLRFYVHREANMKLGDLKQMDNQYVYRADVVWCGNFASLNPRFNFVLFGCDDASIS